MAEQSEAPFPFFCSLIEGAYPGLINYDASRIEPTNLQSNSPVRLQFHALGRIVLRGAAAPDSVHNLDAWEQFGQQECAKLAGVYELLRSYGHRPTVPLTVPFFDARHPHLQSLMYDVNIGTATFSYAPSGEAPITLWAGPTYDRIFIRWRDGAQPHPFATAPLDSRLDVGQALHLRSERHFRR